jgi:hypothetical protein
MATSAEASSGTAGAQRSGRLAHVEQRIDSQVRLKVGRNPMAALEEAQKVHAEGREHKRLAEQHKRRARIAMIEFAAFKKNLEALGIKVIIETQATNALREGTSDHRSSPTS